MAKITVSFDTVEKTLSADIDGQAISNVVGVELSKSYYLSEDNQQDSYYCSLTTVVEDKEADLRTITRLVASESEEGKLALRAGKSESALAGFVEASTSSKVRNDIAAFLSR